MRYTVLFIFCLAALLAGVSPAARSQNGKVIELEKADSLKGLVIGGEEARELIGNVRIRQEGVVITCDRGLQFLASGRIVLTGDVTVTDDSVTLRAPRALYHRDMRMAEAFEDVRLEDGRTTLTARYGQYFVEERKAYFQGRVVVVDSTSRVEADTLTYYREKGSATASGRVRVTGKAERVTITGGYLRHTSRPPYSRITLDPLLVQIDTTGGREDTLTVTSTIMEAYRDSTRLLVATDSVSLLQGELAGRAQTLHFFTASDSLLMRGTPVLWYGQTQVSGDSINVYMRNRKPWRVVVLGNALAASRSDSLFPDRFDQLSGDTMVMRFASEGLEEIDVRSQATSIYYLYEDSVGNGLNQSSCDRIALTFREKKVQTITFVGGVEGMYRPESMISRREADFALPGFRWRHDRPVRPRIGNQ